MRFSWDPRESDRNLLERGFDFEFATLIFDGPTVERTDSRRNYGEHRVVAMGIARASLSPWFAPIGLGRPRGHQAHHLSPPE